MGFSVESIMTQKAVIANVAANIASAADTERSATEIKLVSDKYGIRALPEQRVADTLRTEDVRKKVIGVNYLETMNGFHEKIMRQFGQPVDKSSLGSRLTSFKTKLSDLEAAPSTPGLQKDTVGSLKNTVSYITELGKFFQSEREVAENGMVDAVKRVNSILADLEDINGNIAVASGRGDTTANLEDRQDSLLKELSKYVDIQILRRNNMTVDVTTNTGEALVLTSSGARTLTFSKATSIAPTDTAATLGKIMIGTKDITSSIADGKIGAFIKARDVLLPDMQAELDEFTEKFRDKFNAIHNQGTPYPPQTAVTGTQLFATPGVTTMQMSGLFRIGILDKATGNHAVAPIDIDLTGGAVTITAAVAAIDAALGADATAALNPTGQLVITATNANNGIAFVSMTTPEAVETTAQKGFSHFFGMNDLLTSGTTKIGLTQTLAVRSDIASNPALLSRGTLSTVTNLVGENGLQIGDATTVTKMIAGFDQSITFLTAGPMTGQSATIVNYANSIWHNAAVDAKNSQTDFEIDQAILKNSENTLQARVGVNMHEQITRLLEAQQITAASMRVLQANNEMFQQLIRSI